MVLQAGQADRVACRDPRRRALTWAGRVPQRPGQRRILVGQRLGIGIDLALQGLGQGLNRDDLEDPVQPPRLGRGPGHPGGQCQRQRFREGVIPRQPGPRRFQAIRVSPGAAIREHRIERGEHPARRGVGKPGLPVDVPVGAHGARAGRDALQDLRARALPAVHLDREHPRTHHPHPDPRGVGELVPGRFQRQPPRTARITAEPAGHRIPVTGPDQGQARRVANDRPADPAERLDLGKTISCHFDCLSPRPLSLIRW